MDLSKSYVEAVDAYMSEKYALTLNDTGYTDEEWLTRFGGQSVAEAVEEYAKKYDLICKN